MGRAIDALGYEVASPIQSMALSPLLEGRDLLGQSPTGSGKTAAFGIPVIERLDESSPDVQAIILCPTRELAVQVAGEMHKLVAFHKNVRVLPIYGGASFERQVQGLRKGVHVVIGTPGRVLDHLRRGTLKLKGARTVVLDEADEMLDMGFREDIEAILQAAPEERQTVMFSATLPPAIRELSERYTREAVHVTVAHETLSVPDIEQIYYEVRFRSKPEVLARLLDTHESPLTIVFCNTKRMVDDVTEDLMTRGFSADRLHGDVSQMVRTRVMNAFRNGSVSVLVATDVAARGLDVEKVELVINYDLPYDAEDYVHRIGRTGRAGRSGKAIALVAGRDVYKLQTIQRHTRQKIERFKVPTLDELEEHRSDRFYDRLRELLVEGDYAKPTRVIDRLLDQGFAPTEITAAALHLLRDSESKSSEMIPEDRPKGAPREGAPRQVEREPRAPGGGSEKFSREGERGGPGGMASGGMARLFVNIGSLMNVSPGDLAGVLYNAGGFPQGSVGRITVLPKHSLMEVPREQLAEALERLREVKVRGKAVRFKEDSGLGSQGDSDRPPRRTLGREGGRPFGSGRRKDFSRDKDRDRGRDRGESDARWDRPRKKRPQGPPWMSRESRGKPKPKRPGGFRKN